jgi:putative ABC transport system substrate-binding protein
LSGDYQITVRGAARDKSTLAGFLAEAKKLKPDLVVTWGTSVSKRIIGPITSDGSEKYLGDIPSLFMVVADPIGARIVSSYQSSGRTHVTGIRNRVPEEVQIRTIKDYLQNDHPNIGVIFSQAGMNSVLNTKKLTDLSSTLGFNLISLEYQLKAKVKPVAGQLPALMHQLAANKVDIVYVGSSAYNCANGELFIAEAEKVGLPVASTYEVMVTKAGGLIAVANRYYNVGKLAAQQARKVLFEGAISEELTIPSLCRYSIFIIMGSARKLEAYPSIQLFRLAELINP